MATTMRMDPRCSGAACARGWCLAGERFRPAVEPVVDDEGAGDDGAGDDGAGISSPTGAPAIRRSRGAPALHCASTPTVWPPSRSSSRREAVPIPPFQP